MTNKNFKEYMNEDVVDMYTLIFVTGQWKNSL